MKKLLLFLALFGAIQTQSLSASDALRSVGRGVWNAGAGICSVVKGTALALGYTAKAIGYDGPKYALTEAAPYIFSGVKMASQGVKVTADFACGDSLYTGFHRALRTGFLGGSAYTFGKAVRNRNIGLSWAVIAGSALGYIQLVNSKDKRFTTDVATEGNQKIRRTRSIY